jgi:hypothetical protein
VCCSVRHWGGLKCAVVYGIGEVPTNEKVCRCTGQLSFCSVLIMLIYWESTNILSVKEMKEGISWAIAVRLV